jgi:hypothetical protein
VCWATTELLLRRARLYVALSGSGKRLAFAHANVAALLSKVSVSSTGDIFLLAISLDASAILKNSSSIFFTLSLFIFDP